MSLKGDMLGVSEANKGAAFVPLSHDDLNLRILRRLEVPKKDPTYQELYECKTHQGHILAHARIPASIRVLIEEDDSDIRRDLQALALQIGLRSRNIGLVLVKHNHIGPMFGKPLMKLSLVPHV